MEKELPIRKRTRLDGYDYSKNGAYFLTICTENREKILSKIVGEGSPLPRLTRYGEIADKWIKEISIKYNNVKIEQYVIMPNHIHILLTILNTDGRGDPSPTVDSVIGWYKYNVTKEINRLRGRSGERIFQRSYFDHIVRNRDDYKEIRKYIYYNPRNWYFDELYSE